MRTHIHSERGVYKHNIFFNIDNTGINISVETPWWATSLSFAIDENNGDTHTQTWVICRHTDTERGQTGIEAETEKESKS